MNHPLAPPRPYRQFPQDVHRAKLDTAGMNSAKRHHPDPAAAAMAAMHEHQMAAMFAANAAGGIAAMHTLPGLAQGLAGPGGPGPHLKDEKVEVRERVGVYGMASCLRGCARWQGEGGVAQCM